MRSPLLARRYAKALYDATKGTADLSSLETTFPKVADQLERPRMTLAGLTALLGEPKTPEIRNLLSILLRRKRQMLLGEIVEMYGLIREEAQGIRRVEVSSAVALDSAAQGRLTETLCRTLSARQVILKTDVRPSMIGGLQIRIGDQLIDGAVESRLEELRARF